MPTLSKPSGMPESAWNDLKKDNPNYAEQVSDSVDTFNEKLAQGENPIYTKNTGVELTINQTNGAEKNKAYYDATNPNKQTSYQDVVAKAQGESEAKMNTGTGIDSAVGTNYSWEDRAAKLAEKTYSQKVLEEKQNLLTNRQELEKNAQQYQTQADMQKYTDNQTADKVGWTGGYVLDQQRQQDYLKASIQAQLYGAMELQKYGYDTALAAARLSYDSNMVQYAQEYYNQAVQNSLNEAQVTGTYFSAEVKDMLSQSSLADEKIETYEKKGYDNLTDEEKADYERAKTISTTIENWFSTNKISKQGIKTLETWSAEQSMELQWQQELWTQYNAAFDAAKEDINKTTTYIMLDSNGNPMYDGNNVKTLNMNNLNDSDLASYAISNDTAKSQVISYFRYLKETAKQECSKTDSAGNVTYDTDKLNKEYANIQSRINDINNALQKEIDEYNSKPENQGNQKTFNPIDIGLIQVGGKTGDKTDNIIDTSVYTKENASKAVNERIAGLGFSGVNATDKILSTDSVEADFGKYDGTGRTDRAQSAWVNIMIDLAKTGQIPDGTIVNMDVGFSFDSAKGYYCYMFDHWVELNINNADVRNNLDNNSVSLHTDWSKTWDTIMSEALSSITSPTTGQKLNGATLVANYKKTRNITNNLT